mmetsp:Transcript_13357/g.34038  ORF Transcript_13357/g.34038 Transcript_13357/m.34038 type:complete len:307 (-) Transcript_13357:49-969(-)
MSDQRIADVLRKSSSGRERVASRADEVAANLQTNFGAATVADLVCLDDRWKFVVPVGVKTILEEKIAESKNPYMAQRGVGDVVNFITGNAGKLGEVKTFFQAFGRASFEFKNIDIELEEIQAYDPRKVAEFKVLEARKQLEQSDKPGKDAPIFVEDVGLAFEAWTNVDNGKTKTRPDALIKFFADSPSDIALLLKILAHEENRKATATCAIAYHEKGWEKPVVVAGTVEGVITKTVKGEKGFGWDGIFAPTDLPDGKKIDLANTKIDSLKTFAEMTPAAKAAVSHRNRALLEFKKLLAEKGFSFEK